MKYPINMKYAPPEVAGYKRRVDSAIRAYAGDAYCSRLFFRDVEVVYPDSLERFANTWGGAKKRHCEAKYNFYYEFRSDTIARHFIPILLDSNGVMLHKFAFPSKNEYKQIDTNFTYCKLINIAHEAEKKMDNVDRIQFEYDPKRKKYYWLLYQSIEEDKWGNNYYEVIIDAADLAKVKIKAGKELRINHGRF